MQSAVEVSTNGSYILAANSDVSAFWTGDPLVTCHVVPFAVIRPFHLSMWPRLASDTELQSSECRGDRPHNCAWLSSKFQ